MHSGPSFFGELTDDSTARTCISSAGYGLSRDVIRPERPPHKTLSRGGSLMGRVADPKVLWGWAVRNLERLIEELEHHIVRTTELAVELAWQNGDTTVGTAALPTATARFDDLVAATRLAIRNAYVPRGTATHMHVNATALRRGQGQQLSLFDTPDPKLEAVAKAKAAINAKYGRFKVRSAATLYVPTVYRDRASDYDICDIRGKVCF